MITEALLFAASWGAKQYIKSTAVSVVESAISEKARKRNGESINPGTMVGANTVDCIRYLYKRHKAKARN